MKDCCERLLFLRDGIKLKKIYSGISGVAVPPACIAGGTFRLVVILSGSKVIELPLPTGNEKLCLEAGDAYASHPYSWENYRWNTAHEMLCIVPRGKDLRISWYGSKGDGRAENDYYHTLLPYSELFRACFHSIIHAFRRLPSDSVKCSLGQNLIALAAEELEISKQSSIRKEGNLLFHRICSYIELNIGEKITREEAARQFGISCGYLSFLFKKECGRSFREYLFEQKMDFAKTLLRESTLPICRIAEQCGFSDPVNFVRRFRQENGSPPGKYRKGS